MGEHDGEDFCRCEVDEDDEQEFDEDRTINPGCLVRGHSRSVSSSPFPDDGALVFNSSGDDNTVNFFSQQRVLCARTRGPSRLPPKMQNMCNPLSSHR